MTIMNPQAEELNSILEKENKNILEMLSKRGTEIFFPKAGILGQSKDAKGKKINATIGIATEDDNTPMRLRSIADNIRLPPSDIFPYAPSFGRDDLRNRWKDLICKKNPSLKARISTPVISNGLTHGLSIAGYLFADENDEIILPDLFWGNYKLIYTNAYGARLTTFPCFKGDSFNIEGLREKLDTPGKKKIIILNFPNNPSGYTPKDAEVEQITSAIKGAADSGKNIVVIIDDAYFGLVYEDGIYKESIFSGLADISKNVLAVKIDGATKEDYVWGFRIGFITYAYQGITDEACGALESKTAGAIRGNISNASNLSQSLVLHAMDSPSYSQEKKEKYDILKARYDRTKSILKEHPEYGEYFEALPFNSGYFMCLRLKKTQDANIIRKILLDRYDTGVISLGNLLRISYSSVNQVLLPLLFDNIYKACKNV
ncbi:MAG: aminotransferase class I/II-fold pyridoxal phosphate-dependent enzyme [archaeon]